jgi:molecular chaperone GrpE
MGIESFSPVGERFDPSVHEAVATTEHSPAGAARGTVVEVYQPGYRLGENIIRPARVVVAA